MIDLTPRRMRSCAASTATPPCANSPMPVSRAMPGSRLVEVRHWSRSARACFESAQPRSRSKASCVASA